MTAHEAINIAILGTGGVGSAFIRQLQQFQALHRLHVVLIARSTASVHSPDYAPIDLSNWEAALTQGPISVSQILDYLRKSPAPTILVDNTSSDDVAAAYPLFLAQRIHIATPNKRAFSSDIGLYQQILGASVTSGARAYHESTVGAGLPVISTLKDLLITGDRVHKIEGVFSGTLSFIFNNLSPAGTRGTQAFSDVVGLAKGKGYTEPDPREDLNGQDVARKLTILARLSGLPVTSPTSFPVHSLIPKPLEGAKSVDEFMSGLKDFDAQMDKVRKDAEATGSVLRYVGELDVINKKVEVKLATYPASHPFATLQASDNIILFHTARYSERPLVIQGAGAGAEVTAMGVLADVARITERVVGI